jgi:RimJ/RimL family protein N-acetyltransferase
MYNPYVVGKYVYLRHPTEEDVYGKWHEWFSDEETTKYLIERFWPNSKEEQYNFYQSIISGKNRLVLSIIEIESDKHIGVCNLSSINWVHRFCDIAIVMGERKYRKGSHAFESLALLLKIAFLRLNLRIVKGGYVASNKATKQLVKIFRFQEIGKFTNLCWINGRYEDLICVMLHRDDWLKRTGNT